MTTISVAALLDKAPEAQFVGGVVLLHADGANTEIGTILAGDEVSLTTAGESLLESVAAPEKKTRKRKVEEAPAEVPADPAPVEPAAP
jgi:hypothetical protein